MANLPASAHFLQPGQKGQPGADTAHCALSLLARYPKSWRTLKPGANCFQALGAAPRVTEAKEWSRDSPLPALGCESMVDISEGTLRREARQCPSMPGVDAIRAFDLGQILPHGPWLSCQHLPDKGLLVPTDTGGRAPLTPPPRQVCLQLSTLTSWIPKPCSSHSGCNPLASSVKSPWW